MAASSGNGSRSRGDAGESLHGKVCDSKSTKNYDLSVQAG
jgi:hypothetical protein